MADPIRGADRDRPGPHLQRGPAAVVITDARGAASEEVAGRMRRYAITMAFRMACFVGMVFVEGWLRWVLLACAVLLPYIAVLLANQADHRSSPNLVEHGAPTAAPQLGAVSTADLPGEVVEGSVVEDSVVEDDDDRRRGRVA